MHAFTSRGFPNLFFVSHIWSGFSDDFPPMLAGQARHLAHIMAQAKETLNARNNPYGGGPQLFVDTLRRWRAAGDLAGLEVTRSRVAGHRQSQPRSAGATGVLRNLAFAAATPGHISGLSRMLRVP
ncbi:hypothetical protein [Frankia gtarii]|uniref:hypothetical protein n=1 Tax=Frankia gtarii TaxID=2950102 RepID=UPI0021BE8D10|nr:hypothetical protein [Frankia gtarii]